MEEVPVHIIIMKGMLIVMWTTHIIYVYGPVSRIIHPKADPRAFIKNCKIEEVDGAILCHISELS